MLLRFLVLITFIFPISLVFGQDGLDVVFIIDQSGSMSGSILGSRAHPKPNDGKGKRIEAVKNAIIRLAEQVEGTPIIHRFSVIEFGTTERLNVPLSDQEFSYNPSFPGLAEQNGNRWTNRLVAKNLGLTDTATAMRAAVTEFSHLESPNLTGTRQRKFLLITDGRPCILVPRRKWCQPLSRLQRQIRAQTEKLEHKDVDIWIIGLNDADNYWHSGDGAFWESIAGRDKTGLSKARLAETADPHLEQRMQYIVDDWLNLNSRIVASTTNRTIEHSIRPYLKRATFNVSVNKRGATLKIEYPDGQVKMLQASTWQSGSYTLRHDLDDPTPGTYKLEKSPGFSYKIHQEEELPTAQFLSPMGSATKDETTRVVFQVMQTNGPLQELPPWPIDGKTVTAAVTVTAPSGTVSSPLLAQFEGDGKFVADWTATEEGEHLFDFSGKIRVQQTQSGIIQETEHELVDTSITHPNWKVTVDPNIPPLWLHLEPEPQNGLRISPWTDTALLKFVLYEGEEPVTKLEDLVTDPATWLKLEQMDKSGVPLSQNAAIPLTLEAGYFVAEIPIQLDWKNGEGWWYPGQFHLLVLDQQNRLPIDRQLNGIRLPQEAENQRLRGNPKTVSDIEIELSWFWWFLLVFLPILLLIVGTIVGIWRWGPCWSIRREDANRQVKLVIYDSADDPGAIAPAKTVRITGQCSMKLDGQVKILTKEGTSMSAEHFRIKRILNQGIPRVTVEYRWQGESKDKPYTLVLSGKDMAKQLQGLPSGNFVVGLNY